MQCVGHFLTWVHVQIFTALKKSDATASDYWVIWVLLVALLRKFQTWEVVKALPMMWRLLDVDVVTKTTQRACVEGIYLKFLSVVADTFTIPVLKVVASKVHEFCLF